MHEQCVCDLLRAIFSWCLSTWVLRPVYLVHVLGIIGLSSVCTASLVYWCPIVNRRCSIWPRNAQMRCFLLCPVNHIRLISNCLSISSKDILHFRTNFEVMNTFERDLISALLSVIIRRALLLFVLIRIFNWELLYEDLILNGWGTKGWYLSLPLIIVTLLSFVKIRFFGCCNRSIPHVDSCWNQLLLLLNPS